MSLDGVCDHTVGVADDELHEHYSAQLRTCDAILYGRITYELMEYWRPIAKNPTGNPAIDEFAVLMDRVPKIVFSHTLRNVDWDSATLARRTPQQEIMAFKKTHSQTDKQLFVGSPGLIANLTELNLIDEYRLCVHPVIAGSGLKLFKHISGQKNLQLTATKTFRSGVVALYYKPAPQ